MESKRAKTEDESKNEFEEWELTHFWNIVGAFLNYTIDSLRDVYWMEWDFKILKDTIKEIKFDEKSWIENIKRCITIN